MSARFVLRIGGGGIVALPQGELVIGRADDCDVIVEDDLASRRHAVLYVGPETVEVEDASSRNGVLVDGVKITERTPVPHGGIIGIGNARLVVLEADRRRAIGAGQATPSKPMARVSSQVGRHISSIQGTLVGVSLAALVFRARAALQGEDIDALKEAAEKLDSQLGPGLSVDRELADEALKAFVSCALGLAARAPATADWLGSIVEVHMRLERVIDEDHLDRLTDAIDKGSRVPASTTAAYAKAMTSRRPPLSGDEAHRIQKLERLARR